MTAIAAAPVAAVRTAISGFHSYSEVQQHLFGQWKDKLARVYASHGFVPFHPRPAEAAADLRATGGISHQIYSISRLNTEEGDDGQTDMALPYDRTVPLALWVNQFANDTAFPFKRYDIGISWRGERAQAARYRGFFQADVDMVGPNLGLTADVECLATLYEGLQTLGFKTFTMCVNNIGISKGMIDSLGLDADKREEALRLVDKLDKKAPEEIADMIVALDGKLNPDTVRDLVNLFAYRGPLENFSLKPEWKAEKPFADLQEVFKGVAEMGLDASQLVFSPGMVRGLDYYTGTVFETFLPGDGAKYGSVASGGRFDNLVSGLGVKRPLPGVGGSIGLTRLFDVFQRIFEPDLTRRSASDVVVIYRTDGEKGTAFKIAKELRQQGQLVDLYTAGEETKIGDKLSYVNKKGIPNAVVVFSASSIVVKDMAKGKEADKDVSTVEAALNCYLANVRAAKEGAAETA